MAVLCTTGEIYGCCQNPRPHGRVHRVSLFPSAFVSPSLTDHLYSFGLKLEERVEYLSRAISNAKSTSMDGSRRQDSDSEFLSDLQDKLDVASVQLELLPRVYRAVPDAAKNPQVLDLASRLMTITEVSFRKSPIFH